MTINCFFWNCAFGYAGSLSNMNIWDCSLLHKALTDGSFELNDFEFEVGGVNLINFGSWLMEYSLSLSRFVKTISEPIDKWQSLFALWQESARKDSERGFGVWKGKFHFTVNPIKKLFLNQIAAIVYCCVLLHNMSVAERVSEDDGVIESTEFYECFETTEEDWYYGGAWLLSSYALCPTGRIRCYWAVFRNCKT